MVVDLDSLNLKTNPNLNFQVRHNDSIYIPKDQIQFLSLVRFFIVQR